MPSFIEVYQHNNQIGVMIEFQCKIDDFVFKTSEFLRMAKNIALHITAKDPEKTAFGSSPVLSLLNQRYVKDDTVSVREYIRKFENVLREVITINRFVRYEVTSI